MASNHTTNFNLSQWEENDEVLRVDFNADNAAIEAALTAVEGAYTPENPDFVIGTYTGNSPGGTGKNSQHITLGFSPSYVQIIDPHLYSPNGSYAPSMGYYSGAATRDCILGIAGGATVLEITEDGFTVSSPYLNSVTYYPKLNSTNYAYAYLALR